MSPAVEPESQRPRLPPEAPYDGRLSEEIGNQNNVFISADYHFDSPHINRPSSNLILWSVSGLLWLGLR